MLVTSWRNNHGEKHFYWYCLQCFSRSQVLECHKKIAYRLTTQNVLMNIIITHAKLTLVKMLLINFNKESEFSFKVTQTEYDKPLVMIKNDHEYFEISTNCWICIKKHMRKMKWK